MEAQLEALIRVLLAASGQESLPEELARSRPPPTLALAVAVVEVCLVMLRKYWADFEWVARVEMLVGHLEQLTSVAPADAGGWMAVSDVLADRALAVVPAATAGEERVELLTTAASRWLDRHERGLAGASDMAIGVAQCDEALLLCPDQDPRRPGLLLLKGLLLARRAWSQATVEPRHLDVAIRAMADALDRQRGDDRFRRVVLLSLARAHAMRDGQGDAAAARDRYEAALDGLGHLDEATARDIGVPAALELTELELTEAQQDSDWSLDAAALRLAHLLGREDGVEAAGLVQARQLAATLEVLLADRDPDRVGAERRVRAALGLLDEAQAMAVEAGMTPERQLELRQLQAYWLLAKRHDVPAAHAAYLECSQRLEALLRGERDLDQLAELKNRFHGVWRGLAEAQIEQDRPDEAFDAAASARARFANALAADWFTSTPPGVDETDWQGFRRARSAYWGALLVSDDEAEAARLVAPLSAAAAVRRDRVEEARSGYLVALDRITKVAPVTSRIVSGGGTTAEEVARLLETDHALVALYPLIGSTVAFVIRRRSETDYRVHAVRVGPGYRDQAVHAAPLVQWLIPYEETRRQGLTAQRLAELRQAFDGHLHAFARSFDLAALLEPLRGARAISLVLHYPFDFVPVHAAPLGDGTCLLDRFEVRFLPSADFLRSAQPGKDPSEWRYFGVSDPRPSPPHHLSYSACEVGAVASLFPPGRRQLVAGARATAPAVLAGLAAADAAHLSCHGRHGYLFGSAFHSQLLLAGGDVLSLSDAFRRSAAHAPELVVLSACDSGAADPRAFGDEVADFPTGFLQARARAVVSTSWQVEERLTALLLFDFFRRLRGGNSSVPAALRGAQRWVRTATGRQLAELADDMLERVPEPARAPGLRLWAQRHGEGEQAETVPYEDPFFWAAFRAWGA